ncbi:MAG: hypothetical protein H0X25_13905 [Acidobacteriales bacterium]|nr:hypothetical protein [Terriglobales bacterium]
MNIPCYGGASPAINDDVLHLQQRVTVVTASLLPLGVAEPAYLVVEAAQRAANWIAND